MSEIAYNEEAGLLNRMADHVALNGDNHIPSSHYLQIPSFPLFSSLPPEIQCHVIESLGFNFFSENVDRLAVSSGWYTLAIPVLYRNLDASRMNHPFAPITTCLLSGQYLDGNFISADRCHFGVNSEDIDKIKSNIAEHVRRVTIDLDEMVRYLDAKGYGERYRACAKVDDDELDIFGEDPETNWMRVFAPTQRRRQLAKGRRLRSERCSFSLPKRKPYD